MSAAPRASVPELVEAAFMRINAAIIHADHQYERGQLTLDQHWTRLAELYDRRVRWWAVLEKFTYSDHDTPSVYFRAVTAARDNAFREAHHRKKQAETVTAIARRDTADGTAG